MVEQNFLEPFPIKAPLQYAQTLSLTPKLPEPFLGFDCPFNFDETRSFDSDVLGARLALLYRAEQPLEQNFFGSLSFVTVNSLLHPV